MRRFTKRKTLFGNFPDLRKTFESVEQIQQTRVSRTKFTLQFVGRRFEQFGNFFRILKLSGRENNEADIILSASSGASGHLLQFGSSQRTPAVISACVGVGNNHGSRRKINSGGNCCSRKNRVEQTFRHHLFDEQFPRRNMSRVMRRDSAAKQYFAMFMTFYFGVFNCVFFKNLLTNKLFCRVHSLRFIECNFGCRLVAFTARRHKNNRRQKIIIS